MSWDSEQWLEDSEIIMIIIIIIIIIVINKSLFMKPTSLKCFSMGSWENEISK